MWELIYYIYYKGHLIHSTTWPTLNPALIKISSQRSFRILTNIDTKLYVNLMTFYSNYKLSVTNVMKLERQITNKFLEENTGKNSQNIVKQRQMFVKGSFKDEEVNKINIILLRKGNVQKCIEDASLFSLFCIPYLQ